MLAKRLPALFIYALRKTPPGFKGKFRSKVSLINPIKPQPEGS